MILGELFNFSQTSEGEALVADSLVLVEVLNDGLLIEIEAEVILDGGELFVCHLDLASCKAVDLALLDSLVEACGCVVEGCGLDDGLFAINEVNVDKLTLTSRIRPVPHVTFLHDSCLDHPVLTEVIQHLDWHVLG